MWPAVWRVIKKLQRKATLQCRVCGYESSANYAKDVVSLGGYPRIIIIVIFAISRTYMNKNTSTIGS